jgi:WD40 repeat protein
MKLWDVDAGREIMSTPTADIQSVVFSPDSRFFACATLQASKDLTVWDAATGAQRITLKDAFADQIAFNPDGSRLVIAPDWASRISWATVWDLETGKVLHRLQGRSGTIGMVSFSPDGKRIASATHRSGGQGGEIGLWDAATGRELLSLKANLSGSGPGGRRGRYRLSFSPDGHRLILSTGAGLGPFSQPDQVWDATPLPEKP